MSATAPDAVVLGVDGLVVELDGGPGRRPRVVDGVSFAVRRGETYALVGESGCGKTLTALAILRLCEAPVAVAGGRILFDGEDLLALPAAALRRVRGRRIAMIFQEPMTALNPVLTAGEQVDEVSRIHGRLSRRAARERTVELFREVGIPDPAARAEEYPHRLSGGMRQRVMIAMALAADPTLLIADEPTTALDVTVQAQIIDLLGRLQAERRMAILLITHDLGVVAELASRVAVMYAGRIVEEAPVDRLFGAPSHPYSMGLFRARAGVAGVRRLEPIPGIVPDPFNLPAGCRFHPRCAEASAICRDVVPEPGALAADGAGGENVRVACHARRTGG